MLSFIYKMLEFHPLHYKKKPCVKNHLIFLFCNFIIDFSFRFGGAVRKYLLYERSRTAA